jgi:hypothetical protein
MSGPAVPFVYADWVAEFPVFTAVSQLLAQSYFNRASNLFANDTCNPAFGAGILQQCLYLATAHIAQLNAPRDLNGNPASTGQPASPLVGSITSAAEGSVNVGIEWKGSGSPSEAFWVQTSFGAEFWQATAQFRTMLYAPQPTMVGGFAGYIGRRW